MAAAWDSWKVRRLAREKRAQGVTERTALIRMSSGGTRVSLQEEAATKVQNLYACLLSLIFVLYAPFEIWSLRGAAIKVLPDFEHLIKTVLAVAFFIVLLASLTYTALSDGYRDQLPAIALILAAFDLCILLWFGHRRTVRPSTLVILYLGLSLTKDFIAWTLLSGDLEPLERSFLAARAALELCLLMMESQSKTRILKPGYRSLTPEKRTGILGRVFFWWINPVLKQGYRDVLTPNALPGIDQAISSTVLRKRIIGAWRERSKPETKFTLPLVLIKAFQRELLMPILPRLFLIAFRYSQPILIGITINFINHRDSHDESIYFRYWLVIVTAVIYCGLAISTSIYEHRLNRLQLVTRGALVGLIHARSLRAESSPIHKGRALTLMSANVDSVNTSAEMVHETWAQFGEVLIGTTLLARHIAWFALLPLLIIFGCSRMSAYVAKHLQGRQKDWSAATQRRLTRIAAVLGRVKSMKILVILLEDGRVQVLDPQDEIVLAKSQISKINLSQKTTESGESKSISPALADGRRMDDAAADASRRTGDLALYSKRNLLYIIKRKPAEKHDIDYYFGCVGVNAPLSYFSTFELVDKQLPSAFSNLSVQIFKLFMQTIILLAAQPLMFVTLPLCAVCVDGIATIRAYGWEGGFELENINKLDYSQSPLYLLLCLQRWLNVVFDLLVTGIALLLIMFAVVFRDTATGAEMGVALNMIIAANTTLLRLVGNWIRLETSLGAVSRLSDDSSNDYDDRGPKPIVILDEVSSSLDPETEARMHELVKEEIIDEGYTVIMISYRDGSMQKDLRSGVDAVVWMKDGKVCEVDHDLVEGGSD
ncbi:P-loop containing nucleoside triphosphate hydrolase protein [Aspergillus affinis]|uniref:P-loop containing nucleoside triphosphate hydrolase protein n=1 Tax=Aspergillus affinis TaxID=1070780 RepID=UPI0022FEDB50|nr:P-loop containing nucleoside triphosphate hydrolase protein [Aspergillus affinis]KAI9042041.1 P-loop containing nucleoside triphosphate hydrolase protein [Aspergillus affinis]